MDRSRELRDRAAKLERGAFDLLWAYVADCSSILNEIAPRQRRMWLLDVIEEMYEEQNAICALCGGHLDYGDWHVDHRIPFCYGGGNERTNLQLAHPACNQKRGNQVAPMDLLRYLESRYMNR